MTGQFDDGKDDGALRTIGEVGKALKLKPHVLRYWEEQFPSLQPLKRSGNRRYYRPEDVALIETIDRLVNVEGYTLKGARSAIEEGRAEMHKARETQDEAVTPDADRSVDFAPLEELSAEEQTVEEQAADEEAVEDTPEPGVSEERPYAGAQERAPRSAGATAQAPGIPVEVLHELKDIRARLEAALAA